MKKIIVIALTVVLLLTCACTQEDDFATPSATAPTITAPQTTEPVTDVTPSPTPTLQLVADPTPVPVKTMYVTGDGVNVRKGPSTDFVVVTKLKRNTKVNAQQDENGWYRVEYATGKIGYMSSQYLSEEKYIATKEEQLKMIAEFDIYGNLPFLGKLSVYREQQFTVTDLNQNGRLELIMCATNVTADWTSTATRIFEIDENYAELKEYTLTGYETGQYNGWITFAAEGGPVYVKDGKYYYKAMQAGYEGKSWEYYLYSFDNYVAKAEFLCAGVRGDQTPAGPYEYTYYNSVKEEITEEEYEQIEENPVKDAKRLRYNLKWMLVFTTFDTEDQPIYDYSKATYAQKLDAVTKSYNAFLIT